MRPRIGELWQLMSPDLASLKSDIVLILKIIPAINEWSCYVGERVKILCFCSTEPFSTKVSSIPVHWLGKKIS